MDDAIVALHGVIGAQESCTAELSQYVHGQHLLQGHVCCAFPFAAAGLFLCQSSLAFVVVHQESTVGFVVHVVGWVHETNCAHFLDQQDLRLFRDGTVGESFPFGGREALLQRDGAKGGIEIRQEVIIRGSDALREIQCSGFTGSAFFLFLPSFLVVLSGDSKRGWGVGGNVGRDLAVLQKKSIECGGSWWGSVLALQNRRDGRAVR